LFLLLSLLLRLISSQHYAGVVRLGAKCLSAIHAYDCTLEQLDIESAQSKFDDILNSSSLDDACDKIKSLTKAKELDSSLILLVNRAWAAAKDSTTIKDQVGLSKISTKLYAIHL
jgi:hypothetical protein